MATQNRSSKRPRISGFWLAFACITGVYLLFWSLLLAALAAYGTTDHWLAAVMQREVRFSAWLSLTTSTIAAALAVIVALPTAYLLARRRFPGKALIDAALDVPIVLPPMVVGLCLLIFFQTSLGRAIERWLPFTFTVAGLILAQFTVAAAFAIRTLRGTFDHLSARPEEVSLTLGATPWQAFRHVALPSARRGIVAAYCIAWARSLGEFGPILVFVGATRMKTEVLPTTIWVELSTGHLETAAAVSLMMVLLAVIVLVAVRATGAKLW